MAIILKDVLLKLSDVKIENIYGEKGLMNAVTWVHMVESTEIASFLTYGELTFMTGIALSDRNRLIDVVKAVYQEKSCGLIINLGPYIDGVSQDVIDFANERDFPIMTVAWSVNMANIMRVISFEITSQRLKEMELDVAIKNSILTPNNTELYINQIKSKMIDINSDVQCVVLKLCGQSDELINKIIFTLKPSLTYNFKNVILLTIFEKPILVTFNASKELMVDILSFCDKEISRITKQKVSFYVGKAEKSVENLHKSYNLANKISRLKSDKNVVFYDEIGIYKLLAQIEDKQIVDSFISDTLKPIIDYDALNKSDLCDTLRKYLEHDGSVKAVADELFLHRNTVNYKLNKISELLDCNLSLQKNRTELAVTFALMELF